MGWGIRLACSPATGPYQVTIIPYYRFWYFTFTYFTREDANMSHLKLRFWPCLLLIESIPNSNGATCSSQERTPVNRLGPEDYGYLPSLDLCPTQSLDTVGLWPSSSGAKLSFAALGSLFFWLKNQDSTSSLVSNSKDKARFVCLGVKSKWFSAQNSFRIAEVVYY